MKIKEAKTTNIYYDALMFLYMLATKDSGDDPSDEIELAFEILDELIDAVEKLVMNVMPKE